MDQTNKINNILSSVKNFANEKYSSENSFVPGETFIPASGKVIDHEEITSMVEASLDGWLTTGRFNDDFQKKLSNFLGIKYLLTTNSGSSANLLAFTALTSPKLKDRAIKKGDEVITVAAGFPTTVNPIIQFGAIPVFIDVDLLTHNIDVDKIEPAINEKTKAIVIAHSLGNPFNLKKVVDLCKKYKLWLIEDNCDALGSKYNGQYTGTFGDIGTLSFYPAHHITMGEGGAVFTNQHELKKIIESYRDWGRDCYCEPGKDNTCGKRFDWQLGDLPHGYDHKYTYSHIGFNLKITDMQAACGLAQLNKLDFFIQKRIDNFNYLLNRLQSCKDFIDLPVATENSEPSWFGFPITMKENSPVRRLDLIEFLTQKNIGTRLLFAGNLTKQPSMKDIKFKIFDNLNNTDRIMNHTFWIGVYPGLTEEMLSYVADNIEQFLGVKFE
ncbi:lipopolysaccharide biosynthesis protein RfbH [Methylophilaceae bacterium]|nr:lipopolysaccharide biosynthesis protein RfbH [Methylophilaceae bacterium]MDG2252178.1 lipopolysaccharide biosynthesis protein RfbH [Methylophilaceae bacterium]|tara:strand:+ start:1458 stop:2777 length:1320 start_codon:yes stop_codon:yes gene_type:complete